jgi:hypothetical protein
MRRERRSSSLGMTTTSRLCAAEPRRHSGSGAGHPPIRGGHRRQEPLPAEDAANAEKFNGDTFGILQLTLRATSYDWTFVPEAGQTFTDAGSTACH